MPRYTAAICAFAAMLLAGAGTRATAQAQSAPPHPCRDDANRHKFDFWIGEWEVTAVNGTVVGHSVVQPISGGCGLLENWTDTQGGTGKSINAYNPVLQHWQQFWVGEYGAVTEYRDSEWHGDTLVFHSEGRTQNGQPMLQRLSFVLRGDGTVRQFGEVSLDGGKTWPSSYDFTYRRR